MAQSFDETAHLKTDMKAYHEGWERIFGSNKPDKIDESYRVEPIEECSTCSSLRLRIVNVVTERDHFNTQLQHARKEIQRLELCTENSR